MYLPVNYSHLNFNLKLKFNFDMSYIDVQNVQTTIHFCSSIYISRLIISQI